MLPVAVREPISLPVNDGPTTYRVTVSDPWVEPFSVTLSHPGAVSELDDDPYPTVNPDPLGAIIANAVRDIAGRAARYADSVADAVRDPQHHRALPHYDRIDLGGVELPIEYHADGSARIGFDRRVFGG